MQEESEYLALCAQNFRFDFRQWWIRRYWCSESEACIPAWSKVTNIDPIHVVYCSKNTKGYSTLWRTAKTRKREPHICGKVRIFVIALTKTFELRFFEVVNPYLAKNFRTSILRSGESASADIAGQRRAHSMIEEDKYGVMLPGRWFSCTHDVASSWLRRLNRRHVSYFSVFIGCGAFQMLFDHENRASRCLPLFISLYFSPLTSFICIHCVINIFKQFFVLFSLLKHTNRMSCVIFSLLLGEHWWCSYKTAVPRILHTEFHMICSSRKWKFTELFQHIAKHQKRWHIAATLHLIDTHKVDAICHCSNAFCF